MKTTFKKAAGVVLYSKGSVLLCKRIKKHKGKDVPYGGYWCPFAGIIEKGEDARDAAVRELKEESGVSAHKDDLNYLDSFSNPDRFFQLYILELEHFPKITLDFEHTDMGYFVVEHLESLPSDYKLDEDLIKSLQKYEKSISKKK